MKRCLYFAVNIRHFDQMSFQSHIIAIGKMKANSPFKPAFDIYAKRLQNQISITELEAKNSKAEHELLSSKINNKEPLIVLDETGKFLSSLELASNIENLQQQKPGKFQFIIGGADGLSKPIRDQADLLLSFGKMTWPHMMVRVMLIEQIYRTISILNNHPYHREG